MRYKTVEDLYNDITNIEYGWMDKYNNKNYKINREAIKDGYVLQSPQELYKNKIGICWDQVEFERYYLEEMKIPCYSYMIYYDGEVKNRVHTFLTYKKNDKYYWFEHAWGNYKGLHEYNTEKEIFERVKQIFETEELEEGYQKERIYLYKYSKPSYGINYEKYITHCLNGEKIEIK